MNFKNYKADTVGIPEFDKVRNEGRLLIEYVRGSTAYGLNNPDSDIDTGGIYICAPEEFLGYNTYKEEIADTRNDNKWFELGTFISLLVKSNPNVLEALFIPDDCIIGKVHPIMQYLRDNRDIFLTKKCFKTLFGYASSQIVKARGLNKKIVNPITERKEIIDFCYTFHKQGSSKITNWLEYRGMEQRYCGLVNVANMHNMYSVFYDWGNFFKEKKIKLKDILNAFNDNTEYDTIRIVKDMKQAEDDNNTELYEQKKAELKKAQFKNMVNFIINLYNINCENGSERLEDWFNIQIQIPIGYRGIVSEEKSSLDVRLSSVLKGAKPICYMSYNKDGFIKHCKDYKEYKDWEKNRNPVRYESNLDKNYDSKNVMHCFRLMHMGKEIAEGKSMIIRRTEDREFLMNIRNHKYEYDYLMDLLEKEKNEMEELMNKCNLPDDIDDSKVNELLCNARISQLKDFILNK